MGKILELFRDLSGMTGRDIVGACLALYGPRTTIIVYNEKIG